MKNNLSNKEMFILLIIFCFLILVFYVFNIFKMNISPFFKLSPFLLILIYVLIKSIFKKEKKEL